MAETKTPLGGAKTAVKDADKDVTPTPGTVPAGHSVVRLASGELIVVPNNEIQSLNDAANAQANESDEEAEFYIHLSDGSVERVAESEVPAHAGTNAVRGYYVRDGYAYVVTGVYPVEQKVKG